MPRDAIFEPICENGPETTPPIPEDSAAPPSPSHEKLPNASEAPAFAIVPDTVDLIDSIAARRITAIVRFADIISVFKRFSTAMIFGIHRATVVAAFAIPAAAPAPKVKNDNATPTPISIAISSASWPSIASSSPRIDSTLLA